MIWVRTTSTDRGVKYVDWVSEDGAWLCAEGFEETERRLGRPVALFTRSWGRQVLIGCFATVSEAQQAAEEF